MLKLTHSLGKDFIIYFVSLSYFSTLSLSTKLHEGELNCDVFQN